GLDLPCRHRLAPAFRRRLDHDPGRTRELVPDDPHLPVLQRHRARPVRLRRHDLGGPVRHLLRLRAGLPAVRAAPGHGWRVDQMSGVIGLATAAGTAVTVPGRHPSRARQRRRWLTLPASYLVILIVLALTLVPMLYLILSGFRTTGQLGSNPNGLPHPWVWSN